MVGALIRQLRMERNYSQAGLARGICAASYLSKIEQGQADAGPEIVDRLFAVLGVEYCREEAVMRQAQAYLAQYYEARDQNETDGEAAGWLDARLQQLTYSDLNLWMGIYRVCRQLDMPDHAAARQLLRRLRQLEGQMDTEQLYRYYLCSAEAAEDPAESLTQVKKAVSQKRCAHGCWAMAYVLFYLGQYSRCVETAEQAYSMGAEEGDLYVMIWASFLLGSCYTDRNLDFAEKYYRRAIRLSEKFDLRMKHFAAYNLGASCLEWGRPEQALYWLERTDEVPGEHAHNLLRRQKLAILYGELGRKEEALRLLDEADGLLEKFRSSKGWERESYGEMLRFARLLAEGRRAEPEFEEITLLLYGRKKLGYGFRRFYGLYLVELYRSQRRYKEALRIMEALQESFS